MSLDSNITAVLQVSHNVGNVILLKNFAFCRALSQSNYFNSYSKEAREVLDFIQIMPN